MLVVGRFPMQGITIRTPLGDIRVAVTEVSGKRVKIGIDAPREWGVFRDELLAQPPKECVNVPPAP